MVMMSPGEKAVTAVLWAAGAMVVFIAVMAVIQFLPVCARLSFCPS